VTPLVTAAVLLAAVTHAGWNAIAHRITDKLTGFALISGGGMLIGLALVPSRRPARGRISSRPPRSTSPTTPC
jgi:hypothetical protein